MTDIWTHAHPWLRGLASYEPGKPIEDVARELGLAPGDIIKLASNENPLGPSPLAIEAMRDAVTRAHFYPDGGSYHLREALAEKTGLTRGNILLGCGSNELIELLGKAFLRPGDEIIADRHAFIVYKLVATLFGARTVEITGANFTHDLDAMLAAITERTRLIFIANPNNPTGTLLDQSALDAFMARVPENITVVFDEAYYEYLPSPPDILPHIRAGKNAVALRTFSKIHGLASLRIGYAMAPAPLIDVLQKTRQPFNVTGLAQTAALAALGDAEHQRKTRELTITERTKMDTAFRGMALEYVPSHANFILVRTGAGKALFAALLKRGIIIRDVDAYGLPEWVRISIGTPGQNARLLAALREELGRASCAA